MKSTSEALHLTLAYAAISSVIAAIQEWQDLRGAEVSMQFETTLSPSYAVDSI